MSDHALSPLDEHNQRLEALADPKAYSPDQVLDVYDCVTIGGGTAGMVAGIGAGLVGARSAIIEARLVGGDCLFTGCVPSKALLHVAKVAQTVRSAGAMGVSAGEPEIDFAAAMRWMRATRTRVAEEDVKALQKYREGVHVIHGYARFTGPDTLDVNGRSLRFKRAIIATGGSPRLPDIPGLDQVPHLTNETLFNLEQRPEHLLIVGGGAIGCEMAQAFRRLGCPVTLLQRGERLLPADDPEASAIIHEVFEEEGVVVELGADLKAVEPVEGGLLARFEQKGQEHRVQASHLLLAVGRVANVQGMDLERAGVEYSPRGVQVDHTQRTSNPRIYAAGDVCARAKFTHVAYAQAEHALFNALTPARMDFRQRVIPHATYTEPEVAHVGLSWKALQERSAELEVHTIPVGENNRAVLEGETRGFARVYITPPRFFGLLGGHVVAATVVGHSAGELIAEFGLVMANKMKLGSIARAIHAYPTRSEYAKLLADEVELAQLTPTVQKLARLWMRWML